MLKENANRSVCYCTIDFKPRVDFARRLVDLASEVERKINTDIWHATAEKYVFRVLDEQYLYVFEDRRIFCQCLGLSGWADHLDQHMAIIETGLKALGVDRIRRAGFLVQSWFHLGMTHAEICDLMYGSFLPSISELTPIFGKPEDLLFQVHGSDKGIKARTTLAPQTSEQAVETFMRTANLEAFLQNKFLDTRVKDFHDSLATDNLFVELDFHLQDFPAHSLGSFVRDSLERAEAISEASIFRLKSLRPRKESAVWRFHPLIVLPSRTCSD